MAANAATILAHLEQVRQERAARAADPALAARVAAVKAYQQRRFERTHADLLADPRFSEAARFFLDDLYGPQDFADRDAQFARVVPALVLLFRQEIIETVDALGTLHALSEQLDSAMGRVLRTAALTPAGYVQAWQVVGRAADRTRQLDMVLSLGSRLRHYTRSRFLRQSLRLMRGPARAAGMEALQAFLERGFDTFAAMKETETFLARVQQREQALIDRLFQSDAVAVATSGAFGVADAIGQLP